MEYIFQMSLCSTWLNAVHQGMYISTTQTQYTLYFAGAQGTEFKLCQCPS